MRLFDYGRLIRDRDSILGTLKTDAHVPEEVDPALFLRSQVADTVNRLHPEALLVDVVAARWEAAGVRTLCLRARDRALPAYLPGQYVNVHVEIDGVRTSRPQSISSLPGRAGAPEAFEITVKRKPGGFVSQYLVDMVQVGDTLRISSPEGDLFYEPLRDGERLAIIAGGSGITPFAAMIEHALALREDVAVRLIQGAKSAAELIFRERLEGLAAAHGDRFQLSFVLSQPQADWSGERGLVSAELIEGAISPWEATSCTFFVCGPPKMIDFVSAELATLGVPPSRVRSETSAIDDIRRSPVWPAEIDEGRRLMVHLAGQDRAVDAIPGENLLSALERRGIGLPAHCRSGTCGSCRSRLVRGEVVVSSDRGLRSTDRKAGFIHPCVSFPVTDVVLRAAPIDGR